MSFDWSAATPRKSRPGAWRAQYVRGIEEKARLLCNLGYSAEVAVARVQRAIAWEFDAGSASTPMPSFYAEIPTLVEAVYQHAKRGKA